MSITTQSTAVIDGAYATITISTESGLNVMSAEAMRSLGAAVEKVASAEGVRFTAIRAEGKVFVAGADIKEMSACDADQAREFGRLGSGVCDAIAALPCVTVAVLQGAAAGGGCEIALACDFRIATARVKIGLPEVTLGLIPGWGGIPRAARILGCTQAKRLIFSGSLISAEEANRIGLITSVVADADGLADELGSLWELFVKASPAAIGLVKRALRDGDDVGAFADCFRNAESREGMAAFVEKRAAKWAG